MQTTQEKGSDFDIKPPVKAVPGVDRYKSKYAAIYAAVDALPDGEWLPVSFDSDKQARTFQCTIATHRTRKMEAIVRHNTIYVRNKKSD